MIFERPIKSLASLPLFEKSFPIGKCNLTKPFLPKNLMLRTFKDRAEISFSFFTNAEEPITGLACNLTITNFFDDSYTVENLYLVDFEKKNDCYHHRQYDVEHPGQLTPDFLIKIQQIVRMERIYGNMRKDVLKTVNLYLDEMGL